MRSPELIFIITSIIIIVGYLVWAMIKYRRYKNFNRLMQKVIISILIISFSWIWFVPMYIGQRGESPACKFRFQVFEYDEHDLLRTRRFI